MLQISFKRHLTDISHQEYKLDTIFGQNYIISISHTKKTLPKALARVIISLPLHHRLLNIARDILPGAGIAWRLGHRGVVTVIAKVGQPVALAVLLDPKAKILQSLPGLGIHNSVILQNPLNLSLLFPVDALIVIFLDQV